MKEGFSEGLALLQDWLKEADRLWDEDCEQLWTALNEKEQQAMFYSVVKRVYKYRVLDELSYRGVLYEGFGFDESSYSMGMTCNYLDLHNMIYDAEQFQAQKKSSKKLYELTHAEYEMFEKLKKIWFHSSEKSDSFFICGEGGEHDENGLPDILLVCPHFGINTTAIYEKKHVGKSGQ